MEKIENWEKIEAKGISDFVALKEGAYICKILNAEEYTSETTGNKSLKVYVDIDEGEFKDYFKKIYNNNSNQDKKWDNNAIKYLGLGENSQPFFKGFITIVENSNKNYVWNWDEETLKGKKVVGVFQPEEYEKQDGTVAVKVKLNSFRSIDKLNTIKVTKIKLLDGSFMEYEDYKNRTKSYATIDEAIKDTNNNIDPNKIPFEI